MHYAALCGLCHKQADNLFCVLSSAYLIALSQVLCTFAWRLPQAGCPPVSPDCGPHCGAHALILSSVPEPLAGNRVPVFWEPDASVGELALGPLPLHAACRLPVSAGRRLGHKHPHVWMLAPDKLQCALIRVLFFSRHSCLYTTGQFLSSALCILRTLCACATPVYSGGRRAEPNALSHPPLHPFCLLQVRGNTTLLCNAWGAGSAYSTARGVHHSRSCTHRRLPMRCLHHIIVPPTLLLSLPGRQCARLVVARLVRCDRPWNVLSCAVQCM